jgi:hypothetical protein
MLFDRRVALSLVLATCGTATAAPAHWYVLLWSEPVVISVDTDSISARAARITARVMWDYTEPRATVAQPSVPYKSMIGLMVFDCLTERVGGASGISYSGDDGGGDAISRFAISPDDAPLTTTAPGTIARDLTDLVCARAKRAAAKPSPQEGATANLRRQGAGLANLPKSANLRP